MVAVKPEIKITNRLVQLIARIERLSGNWDQLSNSNFLTEETREQALNKNLLVTLCLDQTTPAPLTHPLVSYFKSRSPFDLPPNSLLSEDCLNEIESCRAAFNMDFVFSEEGLLNLYKKIEPNRKSHQSDKNNTQDLYFRNFAQAFFSHENQRIFTTVSPFLVPRRYKELMEWVSEELYSTEIHPLIVIGTYHLLFLQLHPFKTANHRVALISSWHLLKERGYDFVACAGIWNHFLEQSSLYYSTLRHAERSTFGDWSTIQIWLEFFLKTVLETASEVTKNHTQQLSESLLSDTQRKIIEAIRTHGTLNREKVVTETGINLSTVKYHLSLLAEKGHLIREGGGRSTCYRAL
jgi:Fic family protein